jgi:hypothetical protein
MKRKQLPSPQDMTSETTPLRNCWWVLDLLAPTFVCLENHGDHACKWLHSISSQSTIQFAWNQYNSKFRFGDDLALRAVAPGCKYCGIAGGADPVGASWWVSWLLRWRLRCTRLRQRVKMKNHGTTCRLWFAAATIGSQPSFLGRCRKLRWLVFLFKVHWHCQWRKGLSD